MHTRAITLSRIPLILFIVGAAAVAFSLAVMLVRADTVPTVETTILNTGGSTTTTAVIGTVVYDYVSVASTTGPMPEGTVNFNLYANTECSGSPAVQSAVPLINGIATSSTTTVPATGLSYLVHYNGQTDVYAAVDGACEPLIPTAPNTSVTTTLSTTTSIWVGESVYDTAALNNATAAATGTVAYSVYTNNICTTGAVSAGSKVVASAIVPNSDTLQFNTPGTYWWQAVYSGDEFNAAATSTCLSEALIVLATSTPPIPAGTGSISGKKYNDLNHNGIKDAGEPGLMGWTINLYGTVKEHGWNWWRGFKWGFWKNKEVVETEVTDINGNYSFSNLADGTYTVREVPQKGWFQTSTPPPPITIKDSSSIANVDFGNASTTSNSSDRKDKREKREQRDSDRTSNVGSDDKDDDDADDDSNHQGRGRGLGSQINAKVRTMSSDILDNMFSGKFFKNDD